MAKKVKGEMAALPTAPAPRLFLDFQGRDVSQIKGLAVGEKVEILITGKVCGISQRERPDYDDSKKIVKTGTVDLEGYKVKILEEDTNLFTKMAEEDDDG